MGRAWREDLRFVTRGLWRSRAFTLPAVLTLASGAVAAILVFTLVRSVVLRPLPVRDQQQLILAWRDLPASGYTHHPFGDRAIERAAAADRLFSAVAGVDANGVGRSLLVEDSGHADAVNSALVTGRFFDVLGATPIIGRTLAPADDVDGAEPVVVISEALWRGRFAGSPAVLGRRVTFADRRFTIVGVMPGGLDYPVGVELWMATHTVPTTGPFGDAARREIDLVARLQPGVTVAAATAGLQALLAHDDDGVPGSVASVRTFEDAIVGAARPALLALLAAVALVLAIACANVANLQLMRMEARRAELAVHAALGAGRWRMMRHVGLEVLIVGTVAVALSTPLAWWGLRALVAVLPAGVPRLDAVRMDAAVAAFVVALPLLMTALASLPAALRVRRGSIVDALGHGGRLAPPSATGRRLLVVVQVALAIAIVAASAVLIRALVQLRALETGLAGDRLLFAELSLSGAAADRARHAQVLEAVTARLASLPGVVAATPVNALPYDEAGWDVPAFAAEGQDGATARANPSLNLEAIGPRHFDTLHVPIVQGRAFSRDDRAGTARVAIVSADVAARTWPGVSAVGKRLKMGLGPADAGEPWWTIVGVAAPIRYRELAATRPTLYLPAAQFLDTAERVAIRTALSPASIAPLVRGHVQTIDPGVRVVRVLTYDAIVAGPLAQPRFHATVSGAFALAAAALAAIGLYAVLAASVRQRTREIAIRVTVGATPWRIRRLVATEAAGLVALGSAIGVPGALGLVRLLDASARISRGTELGALGASIGLLVAASVVAAYWPVRRALRIDPAVSLRA